MAGRSPRAAGCGRCRRCGRCGRCARCHPQSLRVVPRARRGAAFRRFAWWTAPSGDSNRRWHCARLLPRRSAAFGERSEAVGGEPNRLGNSRRGSGSASQPAGVGSPRARSPARCRERTGIAGPAGVSRGPNHRPRPRQRSSHRAAGLWQRAASPSAPFHPPLPLLSVCKGTEPPVKGHLGPASGI